MAISPHGGKLINRFSDDLSIHEIKNWNKILLNQVEVADLTMIAIGAYSPLEGFMVKDDYESVVSKMRLANGLPWTIPILLCVDREFSKSLSIGERVGLYQDFNGTQTLIGWLLVEDIFLPEPEREAAEVYRTTSNEHPGVMRVYQRKPVALGGEIHLLKVPEADTFLEYRLTPKETRQIFEERGWKRIAGFQTRNPIHRAHEYLQKCALEIVDGLLIHPLVGATKEGDIPADVRMRCYEELIRNYYPRDRVVLSVLDTAMRYAGPREAIFHALIRQNYGCTHFIVGRDHAGVGNYYGTYDAQRIFEEFCEGEIKIEPLPFEHAFYCRRCEGMATAKTCPHSDKEHIFLSGTKVRNMLKSGEPLPSEFTRTEVARILEQAMANMKE